HWHERCRTQQFAVRFADRMLRNLGAPIHCFGQLMGAIFLRSSLTTMTASARNSASSRLNIRRGQAGAAVAVPMRSGFWTTLIGASSDQLTYILRWESLADLETRWTAFLNDSAWHKVRDEGER